MLLSSVSWLVAFADVFAQWVLAALSLVLYALETVVQGGYGGIAFLMFCACWLSLALLFLLMAEAGV